MALWKRPAPQGPGSTAPCVRPRPLTVGAYLDACLAAGVEDGAAWDAGAAPLDACLGVLGALADAELRGEPEGYEAQVRAAAAAAWADAEAERARALALGAVVRAAVEEALGEGLLPPRAPTRYGLLRALSTMAPTERAALCAEPLGRALVLGQVGAIEQQAKDATDKAMHEAREAARRN